MPEGETTSDAATLLAEAFQNFTEALEVSVRIMTAQDGVYHTGRQRRATAVFGKMQLHSMTVQLIVENVVRNKSRLLDHFTVGTITRSIIDASLMTMYLSEPSLTFPQWELRREVLHLHELTNRKRFLVPQSKLIDAEPRPPFFETYEPAKKDSRDRIYHLGTAVGLDPEKIAELQEGQRVFVDGGRGAAREAGWDLNAFTFEQAYYSAYVHSHPVSFMKMDEQEISWIHPSRFQQNFVALALDVAGDTWSVRTKEWRNLPRTSLRIRLERSFGRVAEAEPSITSRSRTCQRRLSSRHHRNRGHIALFGSFSASSLPS